MTQLDQILGAIMRDLAKARTAADLYTLELSRIYAQDALLQHFDVPRVDIKNSSIELRFAITEVHPPAPNEAQDAPLLARLEKQCPVMTAVIRDALRQFAPQDEGWQALLQRVVTADFQRLLNEQCLRLLASHVRIWDAETTAEQFKEFRLSLARNLVTFLNVLNPELQQQLEQRNATDTLLKAAAAALVPLLDTLADEIELARASLSDLRVVVEVEADKLKALPESVISTLRLSLDLQNQR